MSEQRRAADQLPSAVVAMKLYIHSAIGLAVLSVAATVGATIWVPAQAPSIIAQVLGITTPMILALLAKGLQGMGGVIDGKMTTLLETTAQKERLTGQVEGLTGATDITNIAGTPLTPIVASPRPMPQQPQPQHASVSQAAETILKSIDDNTDAIKKNTAKTDANVQEMKDKS